MWCLAVVLLYHCQKSAEQQVHWGLWLHHHWQSERPWLAVLAVLLLRILLVLIHLDWSLLCLMLTMHC
jgi:hypothetical protein